MDLGQWGTEDGNNNTSDTNNNTAYFLFAMPCAKVNYMGFLISSLWGGYYYYLPFTDEKPGSSEKLSTLFKVKQFASREAVGFEPIHVWFKKLYSWNYAFQISRVFSLSMKRWPFQVLSISPTTSLRARTYSSLYFLLHSMIPGT